MYKVIRAFSDATDGKHYPVGADYPAKGVKPSKSRIKALAEGENVYGKVYIEKVKQSDENTDADERE